MTILLDWGFWRALGLLAIWWVLTSGWVGLFFVCQACAHTPELGSPSYQRAQVKYFFWMLLTLCLLSFIDLCFTGYMVGRVMR